MNVGSDPRWKIVDECTQVLEATFRSRGVVRVAWVATFPASGRAIAWLCVTTDAEREALRADPTVDDLVRDALSAHGLPAEDARASAARVESQETVDRDFDSSWFSAMR